MGDFSESPDVYQEYKDNRHLNVLIIVGDSNSHVDVDNILTLHLIHCYALA